ncbi:MAG TPA: DUF29 domain-containing protein [Azospirillaceae bacterium]|nr:DUF29 domain-containing protein [Azospirillaceae bacterium]
MSTLYDQDFHAWALAQAAALRRAAELRINLPDVDIEHLAEEIEDMGSEQAHAVESALMRIIEHLLKLEYSPADRPRATWRRTVRNQRTDLQKRLKRSSSLRNPQCLAEMLVDAWRDGRRLAYEGLIDQGEPDAAASIPQDCPYSLEQLCDFEWWPDGRANAL